MIIEVMADWEQRNLQNRFLSFAIHGSISVSYTHLTLPTKA